MITAISDEQPSRKRILAIPPLPLVEQLALIGIDGDTHENLVKAAVGRVRNPTDKHGRTAIEVARLDRAGYAIVPGLICSNCFERLRLNKGVPGEKAAHFCHYGNSSCPGGFITPWHAAMQAACATYGFDTEFAVVVNGTRRRLDAYHAGRNRCLEFVSSLSPEYVRKHKQLVEYPIETSWVFNSGAGFATRKDEETVDVAALKAGIIRISNLFRADGGAREIIEEIGRAHCYTLYRGLMFGCVGYDVWESLPDDNSLQKLCQRDYGFNVQLIIAGKFPKRNLEDGTPTGEMRVVRARYELPSGRVDQKYVRDDLFEALAKGDLDPATAIVPPEPGGAVVEDDLPVSEKLPSDNDAAECGGESRRAKTTSNIPAGEVAEMLAAARASWDGSDFEPWDESRDTNVVIKPVANPVEVVAEVLSPMEPVKAPPVAAIAPPVVQAQRWPMLVSVSPKVPGISIDAPPVHDATAERGPSTNVPIYIDSASWEHREGHAGPVDVLSMEIRINGRPHTFSDRVWGDNGVMLASLAEAAGVTVREIRENPTRAIVAAKLAADFGMRGQNYYGVLRFHKRHPAAR